MITRLLRRRPNTTLLTAPSGREGIQSVIRAVPDVILLDLDLPDIPGEHVLSELRAAPSTAAIPVVILSADAGPAVIRRLLAARASAYLTKPLDLAQLSVLLDSLAAPARQPHPRNGTAVTSATRGMPGLRRGASLPPGGADPANRVVLYIEDDQSNATLVASCSPAARTPSCNSRHRPRRCPGGHRQATGPDPARQSPPRRDRGGNPAQARVRTANGYHPRDNHQR